MPRLPFLLSIVHGGSTLPRELAQRLAINQAAVFYDSNPWSREVFSMGEYVQGRLEVDIARAVVDVDAEPSSRVPAPDGGVIKTITRYNKQVWQEGQEPNSEERLRLIDRYHRTYHDILERTASRGGVRMGIDCHSMSPIGAPMDPDPGQLRPMFCLGNRGDENGEGQMLSCDSVYLQAFADCLRREFANLELPEGVELVKFNSPLSGGYVLKRQTQLRSERNVPTPWMLFAFNRRLLVPDEDPEACLGDVVPDVPREPIEKLRVRVYNTLLAFARRLPAIIEAVEAKRGR